MGAAASVGQGGGIAGEEEEGEHRHQQQQDDKEEKGGGEPDALQDHHSNNKKKEEEAGASGPAAAGGIAEAKTPAPTAAGEDDRPISEAKGASNSTAAASQPSPPPTKPHGTLDDDQLHSIKGLATKNSMRRIGSYLTRDEVNAMLTPATTEEGGGGGAGRAGSFRGKAGLGGGGGAAIGAGGSAAAGPLTHKGSQRMVGGGPGGKHLLHHHHASALAIQKIVEVDEKEWPPDSPAHQHPKPQAKDADHSNGEEEEEEEDVSEYFDNDEKVVQQPPLSGPSGAMGGSRATGGSGCAGDAASSSKADPPSTSAGPPAPTIASTRIKAVSFDQKHKPPPTVVLVDPPKPAAPKLGGLKAGGGLRPPMGLTVQVDTNTATSSNDDAAAVAKTQRAGEGSNKKQAPPTVVTTTTQQAKGQGGGKGPGGLKVQTGYEDDDDWIQVDDQEDGMAGDMSPRSNKKAALSAHAGGDDGGAGGEGLAQVANSYIFSKSGTITVNGFDAAIGEGGIVSLEDADGPGGESSRIPMRDRLVVLSRLGQGCSGIVYKAFDLLDLRLVALKVIPVFDQSKRRQMAKELSILYQNLKLSPRQQQQQQQQEEGKGGVEASPSSSSTAPTANSRYVVAFYDAFSNMEDATVSLMVEYMDGGSLQDIADAGGCRYERTLAQIAYQSLLGLQFIHGCRQIHRDLKPANMLINRVGEVKISDFGIVRKLGDEDDDDDDNGLRMVSSSNNHTGGGRGGTMGDKAHTFVGTVTYMSPERINGEDYSYSSDVWSLGLALMTVALGKLPISTKAGYWSILQCVRDEEPPVLPPGHWSEHFRHFLSRLLQKDPSKRSTCTDLLLHPFLDQAREAHKSGRMTPGPIGNNNSSSGGNGNRNGDDDDEGGGGDDRRMSEGESLGELEAILAAVKDHLQGISTTHLTRLLEKEGAEVKGEAPPPLPDVMRLILLARGEGRLQDFSNQLQLPQATIRAEVAHFINNITTTTT